MLVTDSGHLGVGYVPDPLVDLVRDIADADVSVLRGNGPEAGLHMRLLVRLEGYLQSEPFTGPDWAIVE